MPRDKLKIKYDASPEKIKEMTQGVHEGDRIVKVIRGLQLGKSDAELKQMLDEGGEFPKGTLSKIKKELRKP
jgi:hypothetical protein